MKREELHRRLDWYDELNELIAEIGRTLADKMKRGKRTPKVLEIRLASYITQRDVCRQQIVEAVPE
jgi:hypothetical protein